MVIIDFETRSKVDLKESGIIKYAKDPSTEVLMLAYKIDNGPVQQWFPSQAFPDELRPSQFFKTYAFNSFFEFNIWNEVCVPKYGWPRISINCMQDAQALCGRFGLPQNLEDAAKVLRVPVQKDACGKRIIKLFCIPPFAPTSGPDWELFKEYNRHDVEATYGVLNALPVSHLEGRENRIWQLNHVINMRGIPIARDEAEQIYKVTTVFLDEHNSRLPDITNGMVEKVTQVARIKNYMESLGFPCESLTVDELAKWLKRDDLPENLTEVLEIRAGMGLSSLGKYRRILNEEYNGRMYNNSRYYGAHTGRITGMGFQLLNLPRASVSDPEAEIQSFFDLSVCFKNPVLSARALVRPMIKAPEGKTLLVADYSSIEYVLLMYMCEEHMALQRFANGLDQYKDLATHMYSVAYDKVTKDQRQMGKIGVLGCGYGLGAQGFIRYADQWGVKVNLKTAHDVVSGFRGLYPGVPKFWYAAQECALNAVDMPGRKFVTNRVAFEVVKDRNKKKWLRMTLPSGRAMYYYNPSIEEGLYGPCVASWAVDQKTKTWAKKQMTPGKWVENIIQALGRDLLYHAKFLLEENGFPIIFSVYDEVASEVNEDKADLDRFIELFTAVPDWANGLPLKADGYVSKRYKKG